MPQPFKHPKSGVYYYRKVVPEALRAALGKTEFRISLGTKDIREAKRLYPATAAEVDAKLSQATGGPVSLTIKQIAALAGRWYRESIARHDENPGDELGWDVWADQLRDAYHGGKTSEIVRPIVDDLLKVEGLVLDAQSRAKLDEAVLVNALEFAETQIRKAQGDYSPDPFLSTIPEWKPPQSEKASDVSKALSLDALFERWEKETNSGPRTRYDWKRIVKKLTQYLGHDDALRITQSDIAGWRDALLEAQLDPNTVENHLIVVSTIFSRAVKNKQLPGNPAEGVKVSVKRHPSKRKLPFSREDAAVLLAAARREKGAKRWVPWLLAFTGARLEEVCQSLVKDVRQEDGNWFLDINADDPGKTLKNSGSARKVPLHPALIEEGFLTYVGALPKNGPIFPDLTPDRFGRRGGNATKVLGRWVRAQGITDPRKSPNHAWRHWFKDQCRAAAIDKAIHDALTGHSSGDVGDG